jgi:hypothetical protein
MSWFNVLTRIVGVLCILMAAYQGAILHNYAEGCYLFIIAVLLKD